MELLLRWDFASDFFLQPQASRLQPMQMNVHECPRCGSHVRHGGDPHECGRRDDSHIRYNLATTDEEKAALSEAVRLLHGIDEAFWYCHRPEMLAIVQRLRRDGHPDPKVMARITPRSTDKSVRG